MSATPHEDRRHRLSVEDYHRMGEAGVFAPGARVELIDGEIIDTAPVDPPHVGIVDRLTRLFVTGVGERAIVRVRSPVCLSNASEPEPDLALVRPRDDFYERAAAGPDDILPLVEVSDSTLRFDTDVKAPLYARCGVPELWIVDVGARRLLRFADPRGDRWGREDIPDLSRAITPLALPDVTLDLSAPSGPAP